MPEFVKVAPLVFIQAGETAPDDLVAYAKTLTVYEGTEVPIYLGRPAEVEVTKYGKNDGDRTRVYKTTAWAVWNVEDQDWEPMDFVVWQPDSARWEYV